MTIEQIGRRYYITGNTYSHRNELRAAGCHWDGARRAWWTGKREVAEALVARLGQTESNGNGHSRSDDAPGLDAEVKAKVRYKGKVYYALWMGRTKRGTEAAKLAFRDGSKSFWADLSECEIIKRYGREDWRTGRTSYPTIRSLRKYAEQARQAESQGKDVAEYRAEKSGRCRGCGGPIEDAPHHRAMGGYCGSCAFDEYDE